MIDSMMERIDNLAELEMTVNELAPAPVLPSSTVDPKWIEGQRRLGWPDMHPEDYCHICGKPNELWCAESRDDWLAATSEWASKTGREGICCVACFTRMYREQAGSNPIWMLRRFNASALPSSTVDEDALAEVILKAIASWAVSGMQVPGDSRPQFIARAVAEWLKGQGGESRGE